MLDTAKRMVWNSSIGGTPLSKFLQVRRDSIYFPELDATYKTIAADAQKEHGLNPHAFIIDEAHATMETERELYDTLLTAQGARDNPLAISITTAGPMPSGPFYELYRYGKEVNDGICATTRTSRCSGTRPTGRRRSTTGRRGARTRTPRSGCSCARSSSSKPPPPSSPARRRSSCSAGCTSISGRRRSSGGCRTRRSHLACDGIPVIRTARTSGSRSTPPSRATRSRSRWCTSRTRTWRTAPGRCTHGPGGARRSSSGSPPSNDGGYIDPRDVEIYVLGLAEKYQINRISYDPAYMGCSRTRSPTAAAGGGVPAVSQRMERATETFQRVILDERDAPRRRQDPAPEQIASIATKPTERGVRITKRGSMPVDMAVAFIFFLAMALDDALGGEEPEHGRSS
jgi:hypothetical protein